MLGYRGGRPAGRSPKRRNRATRFTALRYGERKRGDDGYDMAAEALEEKVGQLRSEALRVVEGVFRLAFEPQSSERLAVATVLMQQVAEDLAAVEQLVAGQERQPTLRLLRGGAADR
jgi:hypothetical protein